MIGKISAERVYFNGGIFVDEEVTFNRDGAKWKLVGITAKQMYGRKISRTGLGEQKGFTYNENTMLTIS